MKLLYVDIAEKRYKYQDIIEEFVLSGENSAQILEYDSWSGSAAVTFKYTIKRMGMENKLKIITRDGKIYIKKTEES